MLDLNKLLNEFFGNRKLDFFDNSEFYNDFNGKWKKETYVSDDGSTHIIKLYYSNLSPDEITENKHKNKEILDLKNKLKNAIEKQDFENAITLRDTIQKLENEKINLVELEKSLEKAVETENFELAIELRDKINKIKTK